MEKTTVDARLVEEAVQGAKVVGNSALEFGVATKQAMRVYEGFQWLGPGPGPALERLMPKQELTTNGMTTGETCNDRRTGRLQM